MTRISPTGNRRGFTLLELLVTLVILVLMTGVAAVSIAPTLEDARLRAGSRMVLAALRYARSYAVAQKTEARVVLDADRRGVAVVARESAAAGEEETWRPVTTQAGRFRSLPSGVVLLTADGTEELTEDMTVTFSALGQSEEASILLRNARGQERGILVDAVTGRSALADDEP